MLAAISYTPIPIFELGPLRFSLHGLFAALGFLVGAWLMMREAQRRGFSLEKLNSVLTWALVASILGARLFTIPPRIGDPGYGFSEAFGLAGDFSILGGYAGGILIGWLRMRMLDADVKTHMDMAAVGLAIGAVVGRIGDVAIVEHLGSPTDFFLGFAIKPGHDVSPQHDALECTPAEAIDGICGIYHHSALYDMLGALVLLGFLYWLRKNWTSRRYGQMFAVWMIWYGFQRFLIDFTRLGGAETGITADSIIGPFTGSQWGGLGAALLGAIIFLRFRRSSPVVSPQEDVARGAHPVAAGVAPGATAESPDDVGDHAEA